jgi:hypothetical protein
MGIEQYHKTMVMMHPEAFKSKWLNSYDNLYIDINFALHHVHYGTTNQNQILYKFFSFIEKFVIMFGPTRSITIAGDGCAPLSKLLLQRQRRLDTSRGEIKNLESSSLIFSPGTVFMNTIQQKLEVFMEKIKLAYNIDIEYMIPCSGEAEHKLKEAIMKNIEKNINDTHILISNDADNVAMFGTFDINSYSKIFICCNIKNIEILSMGALMNSHTQKYGITKTFGLDFTFISILMGNDYLPKISFIDLTKAWTAYRKWHREYKEGLILDNKNINVGFFVGILNSVIANTKQHYIFKFGINDYNSLIYANYTEGLLWCLDMYNKGKCDRYNYMCYSSSPHPLGLILNLHKDPTIAKFKDIVYPSIDPNLYAILVFPQKALSLVDAKYHNFAKKYDILYEVELCPVCIELHKELKNYKVNEKMYKDVSKEIKIHKINHDVLTIDDIETIVKDFNREFMEID